jgi:hypothetical protein
MELREDELKGLKASIKERELERSSLPVDDRESRLALTREIAVDKERLLLMEQQGKFASPISVVLSHSYRSHIFAHSLSTSPRYSHALFSFFFKLPIHRDWSSFTRIILHDFDSIL